MAAITTPKPKKNRAKRTKAVPARETRLDATHLRKTTKTTDNKGRVVLGSGFANRAVIVEQLSNTELLIKLARVIPESEAWVYGNPEAIGAVRNGLAQARAGEIGEGPDVDADAELAAKLEG